MGRSGRWEKITTKSQKLRRKEGSLSKKSQSGDKKETERRCRKIPHTLSFLNEFNRNGDIKKTWKTKTTWINFVEMYEKNSQNL